MNLCANVFVFGGFNVHRKGWITCSGETLWFFYLKWPYSDDQLFYVDPKLWLSVWLFWICFFWCKYLFYDGFPSIGRFWSCLSFHWLSFTLKRGWSFSSHSLWLFSADWDGLCDHSRDVSWDDIFKHDVSGAGSLSCERFHVAIVVKMWPWTIIHTNWTLQYVLEGIWFTTLLQGLICSSCI